MQFDKILKEIIIGRSVLQQIEPIHSSTKTKINLSNLDKNLALYILGGRAITLSYTALLLLANCRMSEIGAVIRLIEETVYLADYFYDSNESDPNITKWLSNKIISPMKARKAQSNIFKKVFGKTDNMFEQKINELYGGMSEYIHPTYRISKLNLNIITLEYDYEWIDRKNYDIKIFISVAQALVSVINMFRYCKDFYMVDARIDAQLNNEISKLDSLNI